MARNLFILKDVAGFAPGAFENTAVEQGAIRLGKNGSIYLPAGSYTSPAFSADAFLRMLPCWNADTPPGTSVEVQARLASGGRWSRWFSFGKWSPFIKRASPEPHEDDVAQTDGEYITLQQGKTPAASAQIRVFLYTNDASLSPAVWLLGVASEPVRAVPDDCDATDRLLEIPAYSCLVRDPSIAGHIASPTTLAMLMNRWGEDVLPEEVARAMYDNGAGRFGNAAFVSAAAGMYGYECHPCFCGIGFIRHEVRRGRAVAARVHYRAADLSDENGEGEEQASQKAEKEHDLPLLRQAVADSRGHFVAVRGFERRDDGEWVLVNDPLSSADSKVAQWLSLEQFGQIYMGLCFSLRRGPAEAGFAKPVRLLTQLQVVKGKIQLSTHGEELEPGISIPGKLANATICYTLSDGTAYASAAQKTFYYLRLNKKKQIPFDEASAAGHKFTLYFIGARGTTWVAETSFSKEMQGGRQ